MFAIKKLVLVAACVALAIGSATVAAEPQSAHLRVHVHGHATKELQQASSGTGADLGATVGGSGKGDDDSDDDSDDSDDSDDKDAAGSSGSAATAGVVGDDEPAATTTAPPADDNDDDTGNAATVEPTVDVVIEVVPDATEAPPSGDKPFCTGEGEYQVSVEYAEGAYCVKGQACVSDHTDGVCPGPQEGLPFGSRCDKVLSGVYGCTVNREAPAEPNVPPSTATDDGAEPSESSDDSDDSPAAVDSADFCPGDEEFEMSVEGATGVYCIKGRACVANIGGGVCPGPQKGLPFGSHCGKVKSGAFGCIVNVDGEQSKGKAKSKAKTRGHNNSKKVKANAKTRGHSSSKKAAAKKETSAHRASTKSKAAASKTTKSKSTKSKTRSHRRNSHGKRHQ